MKIPERFLLGVNYWPRNRGVRMWRDWRPAEIDREFREIRALGCTVARVFLTWDDFQPLVEKGYHGHAGWVTREIVMRHDETITAETCPAMVDERMVARFDELLRIAGRHNLKLIVALMTGWMSGVLLDVAWRRGRNVWSDPFMLKWQLLYGQYFARRYRNEQTILGWEFGNEHNCFMHCETPEAAWTWMRTIANQLRMEDSNHPVISGMHGLVPYPSREKNAWGIRESAASCDLLTVHPYPIFTRGCNLDRLTDMRANLHASAESRYYGCLGGKPVLCEETGSLGDTHLCEERAADFIRLRLYSLLANGDRGCLWWCFSDFNCPDSIPHRWNQMEIESLGMTATDGRVKPVGREYRKFSQVVRRIGRLPPTAKKAAIVLMAGVNQWELYYNTFVLCKQAGIEADFIFSHQSFDPYRLLIYPAVAGHEHCTVPDWQRMRAFVERGGTLYLSYDGAALMHLPAIFGIRCLARLAFPDTRVSKLAPTDRTPAILQGPAYTYSGKPRFLMECESTGARVLLQWPDGLPAMTEYRCGKGKTVFLGLPVEALLAQTPYAYDQDQTWRVYEYLKTLAGISPALDLAAPRVERTYHPLSPTEGYWVLINYERQDWAGEVGARKPPAQMTIVSGAAGGAVARARAGWRVTLPALGTMILKVRWR